MNYFAHAIRHLDRPNFLAGLALPDWLSVSDRKTRLRQRHLLEHLPHFEPAEREIAAGVLQHLEDDHWFHATTAFQQVTSGIGTEFRLVLPTAEEWPCGFLGPLLCELLIDAELARRQLDLLEQYYAQMSQWQPQEIQQLVNRVAPLPAQQLAQFIPLFIRERFLFDCVGDQPLLRRVNQVLRRVNLQPLPAIATKALARGRELVAAQITELLPEPDFAPYLASAAGEHSAA